MCINSPYMTHKELHDCCQWFQVPNVGRVSAMILAEEKANVYIALAGNSAEGHDMGLGVFANKEHEAGIKLMRIKGFFFPKGLGTKMLNDQPRTDYSLTLLDKDDWPEDTLTSRCSKYTFNYDNVHCKLIDFHMAKTAASFLNNCVCRNGTTVPHNVAFKVAQEGGKIVGIWVVSAIKISKVTYHIALLLFHYPF